MVVVILSAVCKLCADIFSLTPHSTHCSLCLVKSVICSTPISSLLPHCCFRQIDEVSYRLVDLVGMDINSSMSGVNRIPWYLLMCCLTNKCCGPKKKQGHFLRSNILKSISVCPLLFAPPSHPPLPSHHVSHFFLSLVPSLCPSSVQSPGADT